MSVRSERPRGELKITSALIVLLAITGSLLITLAPSAVRGTSDQVTNSGGTGLPPGTQESMGEVSHAFRQEVSALEAQLAEDPLDTTSLLRLGDLLLAAHQAERSVELYQRLTGILETNDLAWLGLTQAYGALGQWDEALGAAESLLALKPDDVLALYNLAAIHANRGDQDQAIRLWLEVADDTSSDLADQARNNVRVLRGNS